MMNNIKKFVAFVAMAAAVVMCACDVQADQTWSGKIEITSDVSDNLSIATTADAAVYQDGYIVSNRLARMVFLQVFQSCESMAAIFICARWEDVSVSRT